jgi:3D-(3,5/4)-trihydroxycyclohexane-1,2-dione acylhydrolase (decyclizing)
MFCTASAGPGTANLLTAAALAHANRLPMLMLCGDTFLTRLPDPVLQQLEHFNNPTLGVNDAFKAVSRYWDRITHPAQILQSLPAALATMLDPADCGPAFIGLPQDLQGWAYDYPAAFFARRVHRIRRQSPDMTEIADATALLRAAKRPVIVAGGGVQYSGAVADLTAFAEAHNIPVVETIAGRANLLSTHPLNIGPLGVTGSDSANTIAGAADVVLAIGTRLQDFTTGSWTVFAKDARLIGLNAGRHDAAKHLSLPRRGRCETRASGAHRRPRHPPRPRRLGGKGANRTPHMGCLCRRQHGPRQPPQLLRSGHRRGERARPPARPYRHRSRRPSG